MHKTTQQDSVIKPLLEALLLVVKICTGFITDLIWMSTKVCSVTSEPS